MTTPEALRLADALRAYSADTYLSDRYSNAMHEAAVMVECQAAEIERLTAERDAAQADARRLRWTLQRIVDWDAAGMALTEDHIAQARAAIAAEGKTT